MQNLYSSVADPIRTAADLALQLLADGTPWSMQDLKRQGIAPYVVNRLIKQGLVEARSQGVYRLASAAPGEWDALAEISAKDSRVVICLVSAAAFHGITQEIPAGLQVAIPVEMMHPPKMADGFPQIEAVRWRQPASFTLGVETRRIAGRDVRITSPARTVVDLYRYSVMNEAMQKKHRRIGEETFYDAFGRFLNPDVGAGDPQEMLEVAGGFGVDRPLRRLMELALHYRNHGVAP